MVSFIFWLFGIIIYTEDLIQSSGGSRAHSSKVCSYPWITAQVYLGDTTSLVQLCPIPWQLFEYLPAQFHPHVLFSDLESLQFNPSTLLPLKKFSSYCSETIGFSLCKKNTYSFGFLTVLSIINILMAFLLDN